MRVATNSFVQLKYKLCSNNATPPSRGSANAADYDLHSAYEYIVPAHGKEKIRTEIKLELPPGFYGRIAPRSGLAWSHFIDVGAGVIDADYRGEICIILYNHSNVDFKVKIGDLDFKVKIGDLDFKVKIGDRVAQLICEKILNPTLVQYENLSDTERGGSGFGSTDVTADARDE